MLTDSAKLHRCGLVPSFSFDDDGDTDTAHHGNDATTMRLAVLLVASNQRWSRPFALKKDDAPSSRPSSSSRSSSAVAVGGWDPRPDKRVSCPELNHHLELAVPAVGSVAVRPRQILSHPLSFSFSSFVCFFLFSVVVVQEVSPVLFVFLSFSAPPSGIFVAAAGSMLPATLTSSLRFFSFSFSFSLSLLCSRLGLVCRVRVPRSRCFCSASALVRSLQVAVLVEPIATTSDNTTTLGI